MSSKMQKLAIAKLYTKRNIDRFRKNDAREIVIVMIALVIGSYGQRVQVSQLKPA
jgi:hypothetical protein